MQAQLVFEHKGIAPERYQFARDNVFGYEYGAFDVVLYETRVIPSRQAVLDFGAQFDFHGASLAQRITNYEGMRDYKDRGRAIFLLSKKPLDVETERTDRLTLGWALARHAGRRWRKRLLRH